MRNEEQVKYNSLGMCLGRNGEFKSAGVEIREAAGCIQVQPITSRGKLGRCIIEVPSDQRVLARLADVFAKLASNAAQATT